MGSNPEPGTSHVTLGQLVTFSVPLSVTPWQNDQMLSALRMLTVPGHTASGQRAAALRPVLRFGLGFTWKRPLSSAITLLPATAQRLGAEVWLRS